MLFLIYYVSNIKCKKTKYLTHYFFVEIKMYTYNSKKYFQRPSNMITYIKNSFY